jgi:hypothetical protein
MVPIRHRHCVETAPLKSEKQRDLFSPDLETDRYVGCDRTSAKWPSFDSKSDLDCPSQTKSFVGRGQCQSSAFEMAGDDSLQQGTRVPVERC